jgi:hypothetical protein
MPQVAGKVTFLIAFYRVMRSIGKCNPISTDALG